MNAASVWAGLAESSFLTSIDDRERDPGRLITTLLGGAMLGFVASGCLLVLLMVGYALVIGQGGRGVPGLVDIWKSVGDDDAAGGPALTVFKLVVSTTVNALFLAVIPAVAAFVLRRPLLIYLTAARAVRWRLLALGAALCALAIAPVVVTERLLTADGAALPLMAISGLAGDRVAYALAALLLIPAAAVEEIVFRGWLLRQVGSLLRRPLPLIGSTSLIFSILHFEFTPEAFLIRTLLGAAFAYMTLRLGGIELATAAHAIYNLAIVLFLQAPGISSGGDLSDLALFEALALIGGYILITELIVATTFLRSLAGVRPEQVSPSLDLPSRLG